MRALHGTGVGGLRPPQLGLVGVVPRAVGIPGCPGKAGRSGPGGRGPGGGCGTLDVGADIGQGRVREGVVEQADDLRVQRLVLGGVLREAAEEGEGLAELEKDVFSIAHTTMSADVRCQSCHQWRPC